MHVAYEDALAYAAWCGKELPTEAEWEFAARGGLEGKAYPWGDAANPEGRFLANTWQGQFPHENLAEDGYEGTSPVDAFPANGYGLFDMVGNVWEWTSSPYDAVPDQPPQSCCHPNAGDDRSTRRVVKGGSHLCAPNYCLRYRPVGPSGRNGRFLHLSHRLPLHRAPTAGQLTIRRHTFRIDPMQMSSSAVTQSQFENSPSDIGGASRAEPFRS